MLIRSFHNTNALTVVSGHCLDVKRTLYPPLSRGRQDDVPLFTARASRFGGGKGEEDRGFGRRWPYNIEDPALLQSITRRYSGSDMVTIK